MVPVRKPGRPLSSCPHPGGNCGCGSVTAAIPRKQACGCGSGAPLQAAPPDAGSEVSSPTKSNFKVHKSSRSPPIRKQSFDLTNFTRMNMGQVNIMPAVPTTMAGGYQVAGPQQTYPFAPQFAPAKLQHTTPLRPAPYLQPINGNGINGNSNGSRPAALDRFTDRATESELALSDGSLKNSLNPISFDPLSKRTSSNNNSQRSVTGGACCAPKQNIRHNSANGSHVAEPVSGGGCCAPKPAQETFKQELVNGHNAPRIPNQALQPNGIGLNPAVWQQYQPTVFTYPPTYGSWQNPLHPSAWRQNRATEYVPLPPAAPLPFDAPLLPETLDTVHTCGCGDSCECIGCVAHPYNNATQEYVRSAWASMSVVPEPDIYNPSQAPPSSDSAHMAGQHAQVREMVSSPPTRSPSSTTSGMGEEPHQNLSAQDFLFVRYSLQDGGQDGCLGNTQSCPCGDDCECLGCTIHRQPMPCGGSDETCLCGETCECIGCEIHKGGLGKLPG